MRASMLRRLARTHILAAATAAGVTIAAASTLAFADASAPSAGYHSHSGIGRSGGAGELITPSVPKPRTLSANDIANILSANARSQSLPDGGVVSHYHVNQRAANASIEDSYAVEGAVSSLTGESGSLFGVFDGHSGAAAAIFCKQHLLHYLQYYRAQGWTKALIDAMPFTHADYHFLQQSLEDRRFDDGLSGACLNVVHVDPSGVVMCANAGDCRAIIGRRIADSERRELNAAEKLGHDSNPTHRAISLSRDHQIDTNPSERERLLSSHPYEDDVIKRNRIKGRLQPTRGFGDGAYKMMQLYQYRVSSLGDRYRAAHWTPPYTTAEPEIVRHQLQPSDEFLVLSSDGLFQNLDSQEVVEYVSEWMRGQQASATTNTSSGWFSRRKSEPPVTVSSNASTHLIEKALVHASERHMGRRQSPTENLNWILQLPISARRNHHDDLTVIVVFFNQSRSQSSPATVSYPLTIPPSLDRALKSDAKKVEAPLQSKL